MGLYRNVNHLTPVDVDVDVDVASPYAIPYFFPRHATELVSSHVPGTVVRKDLCVCVCVLVNRPVVFYCTILGKVHGLRCVALRCVDRLGPFVTPAWQPGTTTVAHHCCTRLLHILPLITIFIGHPVGWDAPVSFACLYRYLFQAIRTRTR